MYLSVNGKEGINAPVPPASLVEYIHTRAVSGNETRQERPMSNQLSGKKLKSVFNFLTYSRETWFSFSY